MRIWYKRRWISMKSNQIHISNFTKNAINDLCKVTQFHFNFNNHSNDTIWWISGAVLFYMTKKENKKTCKMWTAIAYKFSVTNRTVNVLNFIELLKITNLLPSNCIAQIYSIIHSSPSLFYWFACKHSFI